MIMETIFDHDVTGIELEILNSFMPNNVVKKKENYIHDADGEKAMLIYITCFY